MKGSSKILIINSDKTELCKVEGFVSDIFEEYNLPQKNFNKVLLCISEAVQNCIIHGNLNIRDKRVSIAIRCNFKKMYVDIQDEGEGFNHKVIDDPTEKTNLMKEAGRGIHIIKSLSRKIKFNKKGNKVRFKIKCA